MMMGRKGYSTAILFTVLIVAANASSQERTAPKPVPAVEESASSPQEPAVPAQVVPAQVAAAPPSTAPAAPVIAPKPKGKAPYTGPTTVVELPPTPVLDEEGKQRLDPDGNPMFHAPVKQQRDKHGHPLFDGKNQPVMQTAKNLGYDETGKKLDVKKEKPGKTTTVAISHGTLTVDGMIGKAQLNYEIKDFKYIYLYAPWVGTVVVSNSPFPGATAQQAAFNDKTMTVTVGENTFQIYSEKQLLSKKPETAYVLVDRDFQVPSKMPVMGYGATLRPPYAWPGAKLVASTKAAPPLPENLRPTALLPPCPTGQMRMPGPPVLPGEVREDPCVPISVATRASASTSTTTTMQSKPVTTPNNPRQP